MLNPKVGEVYIIKPQLIAIRDGLWKKNHIEHQIDGCIGMVCADPYLGSNNVGPRPVVKMLDGPSKGQRWVVYHEWLSTDKIPCNCSLDTILLRGCRYKHLHV